MINKIGERELQSVVRIISKNKVPNNNAPFITENIGTGIGSGFFINKEGYILTCCHVIEHSMHIWATIPIIGKKKYDCRVISIYPEMDIALLQIINYKNEFFLPLDNSDNIQPNDIVIALGYPLGKDKVKLSSGIVSGRENNDIQTDTPLNEGNSGGPLLYGKKVIGINSAIISGNDVQNIGFAIPINIYKNVSDKMNSKKLNIIYKGSLGIYYNNMTEDFKKYLNCPCKGVYIRKLTPNSNLHKISIKTGDILCKINNYVLDDFGETHVKWNVEKVPLSSIIGRSIVGENMTITYWCNEKKKKIKKNIILQSIDNNYEVITKFNPFQPYNYVCFGGLVIMDLMLNHIRNRYLKQIVECVIDGEKTHDNHVIISHILPGSYVNRFEILEIGDVIDKINNINIKSLKHYNKILLNIIKNKNKYLIIETKNNKKCVLLLETLLKEESNFLEEFDYDSILKKSN